MGGRGSRSGGAGGAVLFGTQAGGGINLQAGATPPNVQPGQPVPAITIQQLQDMNDTEFVNYLNGLQYTPINSNIYYNSSWDTQRLIANMPELNRAPEIVDAQTFAKLPGDPIYRTVNKTGTTTAVDIAARTMTSDVTTIGEGVIGDGFYFHTVQQGSARYGSTRNNINATAMMTAKLNSNAKVVSSASLNSMLNGESRAVRNAVQNMKSGGMWTGDSGLMAYALHKGFNVVSAGNVYNVIDRNAATWSSELSAI